MNIYYILLLLLLTIIIILLILKYTRKTEFYLENWNLVDGYVPWKTPTYYKLSITTPHNNVTTTSNISPPIQSDTSSDPVFNLGIINNSYIIKIERSLDKLNWSTIFLNKAEFLPTDSNNNKFFTDINNPWEIPNFIYTFTPRYDYNCYIYATETDNIKNVSDIQKYYFNSPILNIDLSKTNCLQSINSSSISPIQVSLYYAGYSTNYNKDSYFIKSQNKFLFYDSNSSKILSTDINPSTITDYIKRLNYEWILLPIQGYTNKYKISNRFMKTELTIKNNQLTFVDKLLNNNIIWSINTQVDNSLLYKTKRDVYYLYTNNSTGDERQSDCMSSNINWNTYYLYSTIQDNLIVKEKYDTGTETDLMFIFEKIFIEGSDYRYACRIKTMQNEYLYCPPNLNNSINFIITRQNINNTSDIGFYWFVNTISVIDSSNDKVVITTLRNQDYVVSGFDTVNKPYCLSACNTKVKVYPWSKKNTSIWFRSTNDFVKNYFGINSVFTPVTNLAKQYSYFDVTGNDIDCYTDGRTPEQLYAMCQTNPSCKSFTVVNSLGPWGGKTGGCLKSSETPYVPKTGVSLWLNNSSTIVPMYPDVNLEGTYLGQINNKLIIPKTDSSSITTLTISYETQSYVGNTTTTELITFNNFSNNTLMKGEYITSGNYKLRYIYPNQIELINFGVSMFFSKQIITTPTPTTPTTPTTTTISNKTLYNKFSNFDISENDIVCYTDGKTSEELATLCQNNTSCKSFITINSDGPWNGKTGGCLKSSETPTIGKYGVDLWLKKTSTTIPMYPSINLEGIYSTDVDSSTISGVSGTTINYKIVIPKTDSTSITTLTISFETEKIIFNNFSNTTLMKGEYITSSTGRCKLRYIYPDKIEFIYDNFQIILPKISTTTTTPTPTTTSTINLEGTYISSNGGKLLIPKTNSDSITTLTINVAVKITDSYSYTYPSTFTNFSNTKLVNGETIISSDGYSKLRYISPDKMEYSDYYGTFIYLKSV